MSVPSQVIPHVRDLGQSLLGGVNVLVLDTVALLDLTHKLVLPGLVGAGEDDELVLVLGAGAAKVSGGAFTQSTSAVAVAHVHLPVGPTSVRVLVRPEVAHTTTALGLLFTGVVLQLFEVLLSFLTGRLVHGTL